MKVGDYIISSENKQTKARNKTHIYTFLDLTFENVKGKI